VTLIDEQEFIRLWTAGASYADIAQAMQLKLGMVGSRAATLVRQGKIQPSTTVVTK
jgi:DNA-directed RNA polymerase specialized sigma24 family protein